MRYASIHNTFRVRLTTSFGDARRATEDDAISHDNNYITEPISHNKKLAFQASGEPLLTIAEACRALRISRWTMFRLIQGEQIQTITIGRRRLVPNGAIANFIQKRIESPQ